MADPLDDYLENLLSGLSDPKAALDQYLLQAVGTSGEPQSVDRASGYGGQSYGQPSSVTPDENGYYSGRAAVFATARDLADYAKNRSLATGDNGIGAWGADTTKTPGVAIPRDLIAQVYGSEDAGRSGRVQVIAPNGQTAILPIVDKGPLLRNRANSALFELTPPATQILGSGDASGYRFKFLL